MNWKFKLSRRLSLLKSSIVALVMLTACAADAGIQSFVGPDASLRWRHHPPASASTSQSLVTASAPTVASGANVTLMLRARDGSGANLTTGGLTVAFSQSGGTSTGTIGSTVDSGNGVYVATFTGVVAGSARTIGAFINGAAVTSSLPTVSVTPGAASTSKSSLAVSLGSVPTGSTATLTLSTRDANNNGLVSGGLTVAFSATGGTSTGTIGATTDLGNGTYLAAFVAGTAGTATTIGTTINGTALTSTLPTITVTSTVTGTASTSLSTVAVSAGTVALGSAVTLTLRAKDGSGVSLATGGLSVVFTQSGGTSTGTISATNDHADGTYTATFTGVTAGTARTIGGTIGGSAVTSTLPTVTVTPGALNATTSTLTLASASAAPGGAAVLATVHGKDAAGNLRTSGGGAVVITHSGGTSVVSIGSTIDVGDGTYTAAITPTTSGTATTMSATIGAQSITTTMPTFTVTSSSSALFHSDWSTGTGTGDAALRDTGKSLPWTRLNNGNNRISVVSASGLGFPSGMTNVLQVTHPAGTQNSGAVYLDNGWSLPAVNGSLFYRVYLRNDIADAEGNLDLNSHHPYESGMPGQLSSTEEWEINFNSLNNGTFRLILSTKSSTFAFGGWCLGAATRAASTPLTKAAVHRMEWQLKRTGTNAWEVEDLRLYDSDDATLLFDKNTIYGQEGGAHTMAYYLANGGIALQSADAYMVHLAIGTNGGSWNLANQQTTYFGGVCVRSDTWCGAYSGGL